MSFAVNPDIEKIYSWYRDGKPSAWSEPPHISYFPKFPLLIKKLRARPEIKKILDVGCFTGYLLRWLQRHGGYECAGVDLQKDLMFNLKKAAGPIKFEYGNAEKLPLADNEFDAACMMDTLEHCIDDKKALSELERVVRPDGWIFLSLPRNDFYPDTSAEHVRMYDPPYLQEIFGPRNAEIEPVDDEHARLQTFVTYKNTKPKEG